MSGIFLIVIAALAASTILAVAVCYLFPVLFALWLKLSPPKDAGPPPYSGHGKVTSDD